MGERVMASIAKQFPDGEIVTLRFRPVEGEYDWDFGRWNIDAKVTHVNGESVNPTAQHLTYIPDAPGITKTQSIEARFQCYNSMFTPAGLLECTASELEIQQGDAK